MNLSDQQNFNKVRGALEKSSLFFEEPIFGSNAMFTYICARLEGQKNNFVFDEETKKDITMCPTDLTHTVAHNSVFQTSLDKCLDVMSKSTSTFENSSKSHWALIFAATSTAMQAFALGTTSCAFIEAQSRPDESALQDGPMSSDWYPTPTTELPSIDIFDPKNVLKWLLATVRESSCCRRHRELADISTVVSLTLECAKVPKLVASDAFVWRLTHMTLACVFLFMTLD